MTIRWFTDADRQALREAQEERRVLDELIQKYDPPHEMTDEERDAAIARFPMERRMNGLRIDPHRRS
ncbi:hypothetical protein [Modestobacter altitudinis]|uniref:hypothetical protein n=1 Tax=Modestobacter altitudinis TaxID=2213158 RepID=UPI00110CBC66|nr:hypothetical protein [Modestobacter altitudinis]